MGVSKSGPGLVFHFRVYVFGMLSAGHTQDLNNLYNRIKYDIHIFENKYKFQLATKGATRMYQQLNPGVENFVSKEPGQQG